METNRSPSLHPPREKSGYHTSDVIILVFKMAAVLRFSNITKLNQNILGFLKISLRFSTAAGKGKFRMILCFVVYLEIFGYISKTAV